MDLDVGVNGNGTAEPMATSEEVAVNGNGAADAAQEVQPSEEAPVKSYDDLFPSLPQSAPGQPGQGKAMGEWGKKPVLASTTVTQVFNIPVEERKGGGVFGEGDSHRLLRSVMDKTGAKVEMSASKNQSLTFLITGKQDVVNRARRELLVQFQTQSSQVIPVPKDHHKFILGKGGARLQELEAKTATKISIPKAAESSDQVTITGPKEGIEKAIHEIRMLSDEQGKQSREVLSIPKHFHPFISGPGGETSRKLVGEGAVRINIPPLSVMKDEIAVSGETEAVAAVVAKIRSMHKDMERKFSEVSVEVKKSQHRYIIGPKGHSINEILEETGVFVEMPSSESNSETITLRGPQDKLGLALTKVYERANSVTSADVHCPTWLHKYIIGKKGATIQKITSDMPKAHVEFVNTGDKIKIEGAPDDVEKAREILETMAKDLIDKTDFVEINVDAKYHKHIIGKGGSTVNKIKQETDVMINIPDSDHGQTTIRIEGNKEGVKKAKKELEALVAKMENEREKDLIIESRFHRQLIGPKGESIQKLRDDFAAVQISFPDVGAKSDIVKLRGPKDDVDKVARTMNKMYKELQESNYQVKVPIFKQFHKFIIGKGGATIRKIRSEHNTRVELPESGSESDVITITGKKADVEKAKAEVQRIQTEMADVVSVDIEIPHKIHNTMIGSGGKLIQSVMDDCGGVSIKFPPSDAKVDKDKVTIRGPKDDVEKARQTLLEMSQDKQLSSMSAEVRAKAEHHKFLIGRHGSNVQAIRDKTGARIIFPSEKDKDRELITILGTKEAVAAAKEELESKIRGLDNVVEDTMVVDPKHHRHFVARRGEVLRNIGEEFGGVIVSFPRAGVSSDKVTLKGAKNCVEAAKARIEEIVTDLENQVTLEVHIEQAHHRTVMGPRGSKVQKICADHDVQIKIPERRENGDAEPNNIIRVSGKKEKCEAAAAALTALVPVNAEVEVAYEFHRFIIGAKGAGVRALMDAYDVNIKVPASDLKSSVIVITGTPTNVEEAKKGLAQRVEELEAEKADKELRSFELKFEVNPDYHPKIIGRNGAVITQLRKDFDVNVQLPKRGSEDDHIISVTGLEADAEKAKAAILKIVSDIESMDREEVRIDPRVHGMIVGRRGQGIRKIMSDFNVDIKLPQKSDPEPDIVVIMGQEDNVLDCRDHLLNMEEEYMQDVRDKEDMEMYMKPAPKQDNAAKSKNSSKGFHAGAGAPWQGASDDAFPTLGGGAGNNAAASTPVWGPRR